MAVLPDAAVAHDRQIRRVSLATLIAARRVWGRLGFGDFDQAWRTLGPQLLLLVTAAQTAAVRSSTGYVPAVLGELGIDPKASGTVATASLVGVASDGRQLASLLYQPVVATRTALGAGTSLADSLTFGRNLLDRIVTTQVADADRTATSVGIAARPAVHGYVRMLQLPSCSRCAILAGRVYRWSTGFQRHPRCDCRMIPASEDIAGDMTTDPLSAIKAGKVGSYRTDPKTGEKVFQHGLSETDRRAIIEDGANPGKVINAHRGMSTEQGAGGTVKTTTELAKNGATRLRPESIYKLAGDDRDEALRLLRRFGYIT